MYLHFGPTRCWGNAQREHALQCIKRNRIQGIVYLADDDNYYDSRIFAEIRQTSGVSVFPVGHLGPNGIERPVVQNGRIVGWDAAWPERKFPVDMAGFAFDAALLDDVSGTIFDYGARGGETELLEKLISSDEELMPLCNDCSLCYVWHDQPLGQHPLWTYYRNKLSRRLPLQLKRGIKAIARHLLRHPDG
jgi:hypothetical protein